MNRKLEVATGLIRKVVDGGNLTVKEARRVFSDVFRYDDEGYHLLSLVSALHAKGETADELWGFCQSTLNLGKKILPSIDPENTTDLAGTGAGKIKTINVSTAASFVVASAGVTVAKQAYFGQRSPTGSADVFGSFGIDVLGLTPKMVKAVLEDIGVCPLYLPAMSPKMKNRAEIAKKIFVEKGLGIGSIFHLAAFASSPVPMSRRVYGCYSRRYLRVLARLFQKLGYARSMIVNGVGGIPEVSVIGDTYVVEQNGSDITDYRLKPGDFSLRKSRVDDIMTSGRDQNIVDFLRIIYGAERGPKCDLVLANASASLFVMGNADSLSEGVVLSRNLISSGKAACKLEKLVERLGKRSLLEEWMSKAEV